MVYPPLSRRLYILAVINVVYTVCAALPTRMKAGESLVPPMKQSHRVRLLCECAVFRTRCIG